MPLSYIYFFLLICKKEQNNYFQKVSKVVPYSLDVASHDFPCEFSLIHKDQHANSM